MASADCNANMTQSSFVIVKAKTLNKVEEVIVKSSRHNSTIQSFILQWEGVITGDRKVTIG